MLADYHVHTEFSNDSVYPMEDVVKDAISLGIEDICFTDHVDYGPYRDWDDPRGIEYRAGEEGEPEWVELTNVEYKKYFSLIEKLKEKYHPIIIIATHNTQIAQMCNTTIRLHNGSILEVTTNPKPLSAKEVSW